MSSFFDVPNEIFELIYRDLDLQGKKNLRATSTGLYARICDEIFRKWAFRVMTSDQLSQLAQQIKIILELEVDEVTQPPTTTTSVDESIRTLVRLHAELQSVEIGPVSALSDRGLECLLGSPNLNTIHLEGAGITGESLSSDLLVSPVLEHLGLSKCERLTAAGLQNILTKVGRQLRSLKLRDVTSRQVSIEFYGIVGDRRDDPAHDLKVGGGAIDFSALSYTEQSIELPQLEEQSIELPQLEEQSIELPQLEELLLWSCYNLTETNLLGFLSASYSTLKSLHLEDIPIDMADERFSKLELPQLEELHLVRCNSITDSSLAPLMRKMARNLKVVSFEGCELIELSWQDDDILFESLEDLNLAQCTGISDLSSFFSKVGPQLNSLNLKGSNVDLASISTLPVSFPNLEFLNLGGCLRLSNSGLVGLLNTTGAGLKSLNLHKTQICCADVEQLAVSFPNIEALSVSNCIGLKNKGLVSLLNRVGTRLRELRLKGTRVSLVNGGELTGRFPSLERLYLDFCVNLTNQGLMFLLNVCGGRLTHINLDATFLSLANIKALQQTSYPDLKELHLRGCTKIEQDSLLALLSRTQGLNRMPGALRLAIDGTSLPKPRIQRLFPHISVELNIRSVPDTENLSPHKRKSRLGSKLETFISSVHSCSQ